MIEVQSLFRYYGDFRAVNDLSFTIQSNTVVGFLGLNGAGKTSTLKVLAGLLPPSSGKVTMDGVDLADASVSFRSKIGFLPEDPPLYLEMTVSAFLGYVGSIRGLGGADLAARLQSVIKRCQLDDVKNRVIDELSHGYRKRVGIAQAIIHRPKLVILDEPISGLDPVQIVEMRRVIKGLADECTVLVSSHILSEISQTCDQVLVLKDGALVASGTEKSLSERFHSGKLLLMTLVGEEDAVTGFLSVRPDVASFDIQSVSEGRVEVNVEMTEDHRETLVAGLVGAGIGLRRLEDARDELEEIFLDLTKEGEA